MSEIKNKIAVIYCRVSTEEQAKEGISVESQERTCLRKAEEDGCKILKVIKDEGKSAGSLKRPGMQELIQLTIGKNMNFIYTVHSDRLARDTLDHLNLMALFQKNGIQVKFISQPNFEKEDASSKLIGTIMAGTNQFQRDITSEKVKATMNEKARSGYYPSTAPVGYKNIENPNAMADRFARKIVVADERNSLFVKEAFRLYATGEYNVIDICDILYEKGFRTKNGNRVFHSMIYRVLENPFYVGELHWGEINLKKAKHEPLIDTDLFERVQRIMVSSNKHCCRKRKFKWLLSGFLRCYKHECRYTAEWHQNRIAYYHCTKNGCGKYSEQVKMENAVAEKFKELEFSDDFIELTISKAKNIFYERRENYESKRQGLLNQKTAFEARLRIAENKLLSGTLKDEDFKRIRDEILAEIEQIDKKIFEIGKSKEINVEMTKEVFGLAKNIFETYQKASMELKRLLLGFFWERFDVSEGIIISSIPSTLFAELIRSEKAFQKDLKTNKSIVSNGLISSLIECLQ